MLAVDYNIEGSNIGYRWFALMDQRPLFAFGYGLSYTKFETHDLKMNTSSDITASCTVTNSGDRPGADVVQLYLLAAAGRSERRLVGYQRVMLKAGESQRIRLTVDPRLVADWVGNTWRIAGGHYRWALGESALDTGPVVDTVLKQRQLKP